MYGNGCANGTVVAATLAAVAGAVLIQDEGLILVARGLARMHARHQRIKVLYTIASAVLLHVAEIWRFGLVLRVLLLWPEAGRLAGQSAFHVFDAIYLSTTTFTTVGYGDVTPRGRCAFWPAPRP